MSVMLPFLTWLGRPIGPADTGVVDDAAEEGELSDWKLDEGMNMDWGRTRSDESWRTLPNWGFGAVRPGPGREDVDWSLKEEDEELKPMLDREGNAPCLAKDSDGRNFVPDADSGRISSSSLESPSRGDETGFWADSDVARVGIWVRDWVGFGIGRTTSPFDELAS